MSESTAEKLAAKITGEETSPNDTESTIEDEVSQEVDESTEEVTEDESEETEEEELPDTVKDILKKNRKLVREAEARALAAEKALAAKDAKPEGEEAPAQDDKFKTLYLTTSAKAALVEAGITTGTDRFLKMLDLSSVEVDESGKISGLDDQIADLKEEWKDVLAPKAVKKTVARADASGRREVPAVPKTSAELLAERAGL